MTLEELQRLHREVDRQARALAERHGDRIRCGLGCTDCCIDGLTVFEVEADNIVRHHPEVLEQEPHPPGQCAFLDQDGACRVYEHRPYVCRTQGLPLLWFSESPDEDDEEHEERDICPLNLEGPPLQDLPHDDLWLLGPHELRLARLQRHHTGTEARVPLRSLFRH